MVQGFVPLVVLGAIIVGVYLAVARRAHPAGAAGGVLGDGGVGAPVAAAPPPADLREQVGRLFRYGLLFVALCFATEGLVGLLAQLLPTPNGVPRDPADLARALSFTIVGLPALTGLAVWTRSRLRTDPEEARSVPWAGYLGFTLLISLLVTLTNADLTLRWAVREETIFDGGALARTILWGAVLVVHWVLNQRRPLVRAGGVPDQRTPVYLLAGSAVGLLAGAISTAQVLRVLFGLAYDRAVDLNRVSGILAVRRPAVMAGLGLAIWIWFWLVHARRTPRTERWYGYVLLGGVLSGLVTTLVSAGALLHTVLQWWFGDPGRATAATHFEAVPVAGASLVVGAAIWIHHRLTLAAATAADTVPADAGGAAGTVGLRSEAERVYDYLVALVGLTVCAAAVTLVVAALAAVIVGAGAASVPVANPVVLAVTFVLVGAPVWFLFWRRAERHARIDPTELRSPSRRLYVLATLGVSAAVALVSLVVLLNGFLNDVTAGRLRSTTLLHIRIPLGLVVSAAAVAGYHVTVLRRDRRATAALPPPAAPEPAVPAGLQEVVLISDLGPAEGAAVAGAFGHRVLRFTTAAGGGPHPDPAEVARAVAEAEALGARRALVTVRHGRIEVEALQDD